jgi:hypothetical protein
MLKEKIKHEAANVPFFSLCEAAHVAEVMPAQVAAFVLPVGGARRNSLNCSSDQQASSAAFAAAI